MAEEISNIFKGQAAKILACYTNSAEIDSAIAKLEEKELAKSEGATDGATEGAKEEEIVKSETDQALELLNTPFTI